jgi:hypothetical protein
MHPDAVRVEQDARGAHPLRLVLQLALVREHLDHLLPRRRRPLRGEAAAEPARRLLPGLHRRRQLRRRVRLPPPSLRLAQPERGDEADPRALHLRVGRGEIQV